MIWVWLALTLPGLLVAYVLFLRPVLRALPQLKAFYVEADGFWEKVWALCGNSLTIAQAYGVTLFGFLLQWLDPIADALGDPDLRAQITAYFKTNPEALGYVLMGISAVTIVARLRSFAKRAE